MILALLVERLQRGQIAQLHAVDRLEVLRRDLAAERGEGPRRGLVALPQGLDGDIGQDVGEVRSAQRGESDFVTGPAGSGVSLGGQADTREFHEIESYVLATRPIHERILFGLKAVQQRRRHVLPHHVPAVAGHARVVREGRRLSGVSRGHLFEDPGARVRQCHVAVDEPGGELVTHAPGGCHLADFRSAEAFGSRPFSAQHIRGNRRRRKAHDGGQRNRDLRRRGGRG